MHTTRNFSFKIFTIHCSTEVIQVQQRRNEGGARGAQFPGRRITRVAPNYCGRRRKDPTMSQLCPIIAGNYLFAQLAEGIHNTS